MTAGPAGAGSAGRPRVEFRLLGPPPDVVDTGRVGATSGLFRRDDGSSGRPVGRRGPYWFHLSAVFLPLPEFLSRTENVSCDERSSVCRPGCI